jgi:putative endonuclease
MAFWVYIIQSKTTGRYYCGQTSDVKHRIRQHNDPDYRLSKTTKRFEGPWEIVWSRRVESGSEAVRLERQIKKRGIARFLSANQLHHGSDDPALGGAGQAESRQRRD